jgi:hypothetical protein
MAVWYGLVPSDRRSAWLSDLTDLGAWVATVGPLAALLVLATVIAYTLVHLVEVHDHVYDRHLVGWRKRYADDFIIPALLKPYRHRIDGDIDAVIDQDPREFLDQMFYHFVGDRDTQIRHNLVVRVYEALTKYWFTQMIEIASISLFAVTAAWTLFAWLTSRSATNALVILGVSLVVLALAHAAAVAIRRRSIQPATAAEIQDIWRCCSSKHEEQFQRFCSKYGVSLRDA